MRLLGCQIADNLNVCSLDYNTLRNYSVPRENGGQK